MYLCDKKITCNGFFLQFVTKKITFYNQCKKSVHFTYNHNIQINILLQKKYNRSIIKCIIDIYIHTNMVYIYFENHIDFQDLTILPFFCFLRRVIKCAKVLLIII